MSGIGISIRLLLENNRFSLSIILHTYIETICNAKKEHVQDWFEYNNAQTPDLKISHNKEDMFQESEMCESVEVTRPPNAPIVLKRELRMKPEVDKKEVAPIITNTFYKVIDPPSI